MEDRLEIMLARFPLLLPTVRRLNENEVTWMIAGSGCLYLQGNDRLPDDVDFYLPKAEHKRANAIFGISSHVYESPLENVKNSNPEGDHSMQLTSELHITKDGITYELEPTPLVLGARICVEAKGQSFYLVPVEEALLIKAILGRGPEMGKKDTEDIQNFLVLHPSIDSVYIEKRQKELGLPADFFEKTKRLPLG